MIVYDSNPNKVYCFNKFQHVLAAIDGSIRNYAVDDTPRIENVISNCMKQVSALENVPCIPIIFGNLKIDVYRLSLDYTNFIHVLLSDCYVKIDDDGLRKRIQQMFSVEV